MKTFTPAQRAFLENPFVGVVTDLRPDGSPHSTVVWVDVDDDGVSFNTAWPRAKPRYLESDPRVSLAVVDPGDPYRWIAITGTTTLVEDGKKMMLSQKYTGREKCERPDRPPVAEVHGEGEVRLAPRGRDSRVRAYLPDLDRSARPRLNLPARSESASADSDREDP